MGLLAALGIGAAAAGVNQMFAQHNASVSFKRQKELMEKQNAMNMANVRSAPQAQVEGLRMAGFNPAMLNGAGTQSAPTVSQGNADMPQTIPFNAQDALMMAQIENVNANTDKTKEEKRGVEQHNDITDAANDAAAQSYIENVDREINDLNAALRKDGISEDQRIEIENRIAALEESKGKVQDPNFRGALGIAQGMKSGAEQAKANMDIVGNYLNGRLNNEVLRKKLGNGTAEFLSRMPRETWRKLSQDIEHVKQMIAESESKEKLNDQTVLKLQTDIEQIGDTVLRARLSDENYVRNMISDAERRLKANPNDEDAKAELKIWKDGFENLTDTEFRKLKYDVGAGIVKGVATGGAIGGVSSVANKILNGDKNGKVDLYDKKKKELDRNKDQGTNIFNKSDNPLESWTDNGALDQNKGTQQFKF